MALPTYDELMLPLLKLLSDKKSYPVIYLEENLAKSFNLTTQEKQEMMPNGRKRILYDRINWARTYLRKASLIEFPERGYSCITVRGEEALSMNLPRITPNFLMRYPEFSDFFLRSNSKNSESSYDLSNTSQDIIDNKTPEEQIDYSFKLLNQDLSSTLLDEIKKRSPQFFERLVLDLLLKMGYGGIDTIQKLAKVTGQSGDGGIDGIIPEDRLGLDNIYIQAKRWGDTKVASKDVRDFIGALSCQNAKKGVFITTSDFTPDAISSAQRAPQQIALINGTKLTELMIEFHIGVTTEITYQIQRLDIDYFFEE